MSKRAILSLACGAMLLACAGAPRAWAEHLGKPLGLGAAPVPPGSKEILRLARDRGLLVVTVSRGGIAERAGLRKGDVLLAVDGRIVASQADLTAALDAAAPSHRARFEVSRKGAVLNVDIAF